MSTPMLPRCIKKINFYRIKFPKEHTKRTIKCKCTIIMHAPTSKHIKMLFYGIKLPK